MFGSAIISNWYIVTNNFEHIFVVFFAKVSQTTALTHLYWSVGDFWKGFSSSTTACLSQTLFLRRHRAFHISAISLKGKIQDDVITVGRNVGQKHNPNCDKPDSIDFSSALHSNFSLHWLPLLMSSHHYSFNCFIVALLTVRQHTLLQIPPSAHVVFFFFSLYRPVIHSESSPPWLPTSDTCSTFHPHSPPSTPWIPPPSRLYFKCAHTPLCSLLPLHLTHILVSSQSLSPLHLLSTCLPIPESKLKAVTQCVLSQRWKCLS